MPIVRAPAVRYTLFTLHIVLWLAAFVLNLVMWGSISLLFLYAAAGLALVIYCPAAIILSARNSSSSFDHAGGEVAYIVVQMLIWLCKSEFDDNLASILVRAWQAISLRLYMATAPLRVDSVASTRRSS